MHCHTLKKILTVCPQVLEGEEFQKAMLEKLIWLCAFMLVGARHRATVGEVEKSHRSEVSTRGMELALVLPLHL